MKRRKKSDDLAACASLFCYWMYIYEGEWLGCFIWQFMCACQSLGDKGWSKHMDVTGEVLGFFLHSSALSSRITEPLQKHKQARKYGFPLINCKLSSLEVGRLSDVCMWSMCLCFHVWEKMRRKNRGEDWIIWLNFRALSTSHSSWFFLWNCCSPLRPNKLEL